MNCIIDQHIVNKKKRVVCMFWYMINKFVRQAAPQPKCTSKISCRASPDSSHQMFTKVLYHFSYLLIL